MKINIETIDQDKHRYPTVGDYWYDEEGVLQIRVSKMSNPNYERLVLIHELVEIILTEHKGIKEPDIMAFDVKYEEDREKGLHSPEAEPGFDKDAPYRVQHTYATSVELGLAAQLDVDWNDYNDEVNSL